jgi:hypothetical protein
MRVAINDVFRGFEVIIDKIPTADVVEVKHGKWIKPSGALNVFSESYLICSECNVMLPVMKELYHYDYCPNCGARMDAKEK